MNDMYLKDGKVYHEKCDGEVELINQYHAYVDEHGFELDNSDEGYYDDFEVSEWKCKKCGEVITDTDHEE